MGCGFSLFLALQATGQPQPERALQAASARPEEPSVLAALRLSLQEAVASALKQDGNARVALAAELLAQAQAAAAPARRPGDSVPQ